MKIFIATAYWCDESWPICAGKEEEKVKDFAEKYMEEYPDKYDDKGNHVNGIGAEGYWIEETELLQ